MKVGIEISIDVTKIEKERLFQGKKGKYLTLTTFIDTEQTDKYDNHGFISQKVSKEEREQKVQTPILGNCKVFYTDGQQQQQSSENYARSAKPKPEEDEFSDSIPF